MPVLDARSLAEADLDALRELRMILHPAEAAPEKPRESFALPRVVGGIEGACTRTGGRRPSARTNSVA